VHAKASQCQIAGVEPLLGAAQQHGTQLQLLGHSQALAMPSLLLQLLLV
jgi:hypothetical protein